MINELIIKNKASYDENGIKLDNIKKVNFIYGSNGSGKTTISSTIKNIVNYADCHIVWSNNSEIKRVVYNREFVDENFHQDNDIKGIFTLGKESHETQKTIREKVGEIDKISEELNRLEGTLRQKTNERNENKTEFENICWQLKSKYDSYFEEAFKGYRSSKSKFKEKCIIESNNKQTLKEFEELRNLHKSIFATRKERVEKIMKINASKLLSTINNSILQKRIIGRTDLDISELIDKLNISDWVRQGHSHLKNTKDTCPFCQQSIDDDLHNKLNDYFNETYTNQINELELLDNQYNELMDEILSQISDLLVRNIPYIDNEALERQRTLLITLHDVNRNKLIQKINEPSRSVNIEINNEINIINKLIDAANIELASIIH